MYTSRDSGFRQFLRRAVPVVGLAGGVVLVAGVFVFAAWFVVTVALAGMATLAGTAPECENVVMTAGYLSCEDGPAMPAGDPISAIDGPGGLNLAPGVLGVGILGAVVFVVLVVVGLAVVGVGLAVDRYQRTRKPARP